MSAKRTALLGLGLVIAGAVVTAPPLSPARAAAAPGASIYVADAGTGSVGVHTGAGLPTADLGIDFDADDGFAVGDITGSGTDQIVVAHRATDRIHIFDAAGNPINDFGADYDAGSRLAVGDVDGNGRDDIIVRDDLSLLPLGADVNVYDQFGNDIGGVDSILAGGFLGAGDTNANGTEEIWVQDSLLGTLAMYTADGTKVRETTLNLSPVRDGFAVGDVDGDGRAEYVWAGDDTAGLVFVVGPHNGFLTGFNGRFSPGDHLAMGDTDGDGADEIIVASKSTPFAGGEVRVYELNGDQVAAFPASFDDGDEVAVGQFGDGDFDADGIPDRIELLGIRNPDGSVSMNLPGLGASPCRKTIVVEVDFMADAGGHSHRPNDSANGAIQEAATAFADAPIPAVANCPYPGADAASGIQLIVDIDDSIAEQEVFDTDDFEATKAAHFDPARDPFVHYNLWVHHYDKGEGESDSSGLANFTRDHQDFLVSLASFGGGNGTVREQSGTFMHELGHALGLSHGGGDDINHKPNYLSIMNYQFQMSGLTTSADNRTAINYSDRELEQLDSKHLDETRGVGGAPLDTEWYDRNGTFRDGPASGAIDWSWNNHDGVGGSDDDPDVSVAINGGRCVSAGDDGSLDTDPAEDDVVDGTRIRSGDDFTCDTTAASGDKQEAPVGTNHRFLTGFDDWRHLNLRRGTGPGESPPDEITFAEAEEIQQQRDQATAPDLSVQLDVARTGFHRAVLGVALDDRRVYATHYYESIAAPNTTDQPGSLVVVDRSTVQVQKRIPVGSRPRSVAVNPVTKRIYVLNRPRLATPTVTELTVIDATTLTVLTTVKINTGQATADVAVNSRTNRVYLSSPSQGRIHVLDGATNAELAPILIGPGPVGMSVDESTNTLYVAMSYRVQEPFVAALGSVTDDGVNRQIHPLVDLGPPGLQPMDVAVDPVNDRLYVANLGGGDVVPSVTILRRGTREILTRVDIGKPARAVAVNPYAHQAFIVGESRIHVIGEQAQALTRTMPADLPFSVATGTGPERSLYVGELRAGTLSRISYSGGTAVAG